MIPPLSRWYCRARRSIPAEVTGLPSSVKPIAPTSRSSAISVSSSPRRPRVMLAKKPVGTRARADASAISELTTDAVSTVGTVFGIATIAQYPPAAAAAVPESMSSLYSWPGVRRCTCGSTNAGNRCLPAASTVSAPSGAGSESVPPAAPISAISPPRIRTSWSPSRPVRGSSTCAERISRFGGGRRFGEQPLDRAHPATAIRLGAPTSSS